MKLAMPAQAFENPARKRKRPSAAGKRLWGLLEMIFALGGVIRRREIQV
jgi:hypothetical protein